MADIWPSLLDSLPPPEGRRYVVRGWGRRLDGGTSYGYEITWPREPHPDDLELITHLSDRFLARHPRFDRLDELEICEIIPVDEDGGGRG